MNRSCPTLWFITIVYLVLLCVHCCYSEASETKLQLFPNVSSNAIVPRTTSNKLVTLDKTCPFLFVELLDGSVELFHALEGTSLWSIKSEKIFLSNKEEQPSILDRCILGPDYRLYVVKDDGMVPYFLGSSESLLTLYRVDTSALFIELDTGKVLKEIEFYSEEDSFPIPCIEKSDDSCASLLKQYEVNNIGIVFRKFVGLRMYDADSGKSYFANFSRFEPSNFVFSYENSVHTSSEDNIWYGKLLIDTKRVSLRDEQDQLIWSKSFETPVIHIIALGDMFKKERKAADKNNWISFSSLEMIADVPNTALHVETELVGSHSLFFIEPIVCFVRQNIRFLISALIVGFCTLVLYYRRELLRSLKSTLFYMDHPLNSCYENTISSSSPSRNKENMKLYEWRRQEMNSSLHAETNNSLSTKSDTEEYKIGKLIITSRILGLGSHGTVVFEGRLDRDGRKVAIKRMLKTFYELARKEIEMLITLDELSPYVVHYYAMEEDNVFIYLALELCDRTLEEQVQLWKDSADLSFNCFVPILRQIMYGLMDLHRYGVVHRDLKPQNILILEPKEHSLNERVSFEHYRIKIADVGLAKKMNTETSLTFHSNGTITSNKAEGSYGWRAAEVLSKGKQNTYLDIFAAGCILYFVLTRGKHPFGDSIYDRESKICKGDCNLTELEQLELWDAKDLIEKMIGLDPLKRPCAKQVLKHPFFWSDTKKLSFLVDVSDRLSLFKNGWRDNKDLIFSFEKHCRVALDTIDSNSRRISWATKIDMSVLKAPNNRNYDTTSICDLLRLIRNKRSHYNELPTTVQQILGILPCYDREENLTHNFWQYFHSRFPKLLITVYRFVMTRPEFLEDTHFQGYGLSQRESIEMDNKSDVNKDSNMKHQNDLVPTTILPSQQEQLVDNERKRYSIELLQKLNKEILLSIDTSR